MRLGLATALLLAVTGCSGVTTIAVPRGGGAPARMLPQLPPMDRTVLGSRLAAAQPEWAGRALPLVPPRRMVNCRRAKCVALTFDDGPGDETGKVLDVLARHHARATFFLIGQMITQRSAPFLRRMVSEGHEIGNHSWDHPPLSTLPKGVLRRQLVRTEDLIRHVTGIRTPIMRPPYGATDQKVEAETRREGLSQILWSVDTLDWRDRNSEKVLARASSVKPGEIVLMHDIHPTTVQAVPRLLSKLDSKGFTYVTVSELLGRLTPGKRYADGH
ncbi:polysaccharide deacetylase family protein [Streptosporangiaceae bacterium NEAU-GS5]|nr:polysaccharide deacetylase family protein [Streptosporangiaceae bacterium NEAU-GS5]